MRYISACIVLPVKDAPIKNGVVALAEDGTITGVYKENDKAIAGVEKEFYDGVLVPGFVNAHCHIELSHMLGKIQRGKGLPRFLSEVMKTRGQDEQEIISCIAEADKRMYANGIQAVGDHANTTYSAQVKANSPIIYHTFVEVMGLMKDHVQDRIDKARDTEFYFAPHPTSITPHAPYSCSKEMFKALRKSVNTDNILSIHNQESEEENKLFRYKKGDFLTFFEEMGLDVAGFKAQARNSIQSYLPFTPLHNQLILVHNTFTSLKDLDFVSRQGRYVYYCMCPKANLYIEDTLPKILHFIPDQSRMVVGTDSLASNDTLDILEELKVLASANEQLNFLQMLPWATLNGAKALGLDHIVGSIEVGKRPGLVLLEGMKNFRLTPEVTLKRIA